MYAAIANELENIEPIETIIENDFDIHYSDDLVILWRYFRTTNIHSINKYGYPVDNFGIENKQKIILEDRLIHMYFTAKDWFLQYINHDQSDDISIVLRIMCPSGGIYISKVNSDTKYTKHKFVTADLPPEELSVTVVTIESLF